jgi:saccharopine dehydrogenase-like NADP-dependent oxidoreductase
LEWAEAFADAGRVGLILAGGDSGLSNIMCREAADELDEIDYIGIKDFAVLDCDVPVALWSAESYLDDSAARAIYWEDGQHKYAEPFAGAELYDFSPPLNRTGKVVYHLHEEPVTIPRFIGKPVKYCDFKLGEPDIDTWEFLINQLGLMDREPMHIGGGDVSARDVLIRKLPRTLTPKECVELVREDRLKSQSMIVRGQLKKTGVYPCETLDREEREIVFRGIREWEIEVHKQMTEIA